MATVVGPGATSASRLVFAFALVFVFAGLVSVGLAVIWLVVIGAFALVIAVVLALVMALALVLALVLAAAGARPSS